MPFLIPAAIAIGQAVATAAFVVSDVLAPLALGAIGVSGGALAGASAFAFAATTTAIETAAIAGVSALIAPHPAVNTAGSPQQFKPDPNAGLPVVMGRYGVGGNLVYETTSGGGNKAAAGAAGNEYLTSFVILSALGPVQGFETLRFNDTILTFDPNGQACNGGYIPQDEVQSYNPGYKQNSDGSYANNNYQDHAWQNLQLGALNAGYFPPPSKLASDNAGLPEWTQAHGFSGFCAAALTLVYDQRYYAGGVPQYQWVLQGIKTYDPRLDATYPGGAGVQRWAGRGSSAAAIYAARGTWTFSQNPWVHALNFALGHFLPDAQTGPGRLYAGIGAGVTGVDVAAFVRAANIADANGWLICGQWTTSDGKWSVLTEMAKAGSGSVVIKNGLISCIVDTPLTSLGTVTADDLSGPITLPTGTSFTARLNTIFPRYTSEAHRWQMVQADTPVKAATYVAEDGAVRSKTLDWQYVPAVNQACQLAAYTITNGREIAGITLPGKPKLRNYDVGDCFTLDIPEAGLATTKVMVTKRVTDWTSGGVTLTVRTETDAKHAYSLGISGVAPATPGISGYDPTIVEPPLAASWSTGLLQASDPVTGEARSIIQVTGAASDNAYAKFVDIRWRSVAQVGGAWAPVGAGAWSYTQQSAAQGQFPLDLNPGSYDVQIAYTTVSGAYPAADEDWLDLGVETVGGSTAANAAALGGTSATSVFDQISTAQAGVAAAQTAITQANAQIAALTTTFGDTAAAAASAQASSAASTAAVTAQGLAQAAATQAATIQGQAAAASTAAQSAQALAQQEATAAGFSANLAASSATGASGSATAAAGSASAASSSSTAASQAATSASGSANTAAIQAGQASAAATASATSASSAQASSTAAGQSASAAQVSAQTASTQAGSASSSAAAAVGSASTAQGYANSAGASATNAATSATTAAGSAGAASTSASSAATSASQAATSSSASQSAAVSATATAASSLPSGMSLASVWSPTLSFPNTGFAAGDPHFLAASDGTRVFRSDPGVVDSVVSVGVITPVAGRTYCLTAVGRLFAAPPSGGPGSQLFAEIVAQQANGSVVSLAAAGGDNTGTAVGQLITRSVTYTYTGSTAYVALKACAAINYSSNFASPFSTAVYDVISLSLTDVTESTLATAQAAASASSASAASASQTAASQSASAAATSATNASTSAGNASTSAGQASSSASGAAGSSNSAATSATNSSNSAAGSASSASAANTSAAAASSSASAASGSASTAQSYAQQASVQAGNAANSASSSSSSAAAASSSAAAAQQSYSLAATVGSGALNANPTFAAYAGTGSLPTGWADQGNAVAASYVNAGFDSPNAFCFDCTGAYATQTVAFAQLPGATGANYGLSFVGAGWYVLELDVYIHSQANAQSAGAFVACYSQGAGKGAASSQLVTCLGTTQDINGQSGLIVGRRQYAQMAQLIGLSSAGVSVQSNGLYGVTASSNIEWHKVLLRPASAAEIAGNQALITANTNTATISSFQSTQASQNSAFSTSLSALNATVYNGPNGSLQSQITSAASAQATQAATFANQISTVQAQVSSNPNLTPNGGFTLGSGGLQGWSTAVFASGGAFVYQDANFGTLALIYGNAPGGSRTYASTTKFPINAGPHTISGNLQVSDSKGVVYACYLDLQYYDGNGNLLLDGNQTNVPIALNPNYPNYVYTETAPGGTVSAILRANFDSNPPAAGTAINCYIQHAKVEYGSHFTGWNDAASAQTLSASVTAQSVALATLSGQLYASYTLTATAGNVITGVQLLSASGATTVSAVIFQAENLLIKSSASNAVVSPFAYNSTTGTLSLQNIVVTNAVIGTAAIGTLNLAGGSVNQFLTIVFSAGGVVGPGAGAASQTPATPSGGTTTTSPGSNTTRGATQ